MTQPLADQIKQFIEQGYVVFRQVLSEDKVKAVRDQIEAAFAEEDEDYGPLVRVRMFESGGALLELTDAAPVADFAEAVLGPNCHIIAMNALKTGKGTGVDGWHVDEELIFPLPEGVEWDASAQMPAILFNCLYSLVDVDANCGPTQLVPRSHRSGQQPNQTADTLPNYKGQGPIDLLTKAGDCVVFSSQIWHRGARNESDNARIVQGVTYGRRWVSQRFYPFVNYQMPAHIAEALNPRQQRLLGFHQRGAYG